MNRESPPIFANRIFLAPSCSAPADHLRRNRTSSGKVHELKARETSQEPLALGQMLGKNRRAGFSFFVCYSFFDFGVREGDSDAEPDAAGNLILHSEMVFSFFAGGHS
jgi:hypothetical protein